MAKPVYYLWKDKDTDLVEFENQKNRFLKAGFKVVIYNNTKDDDKFEEGIIKIIRNHLHECV
jgi:hypothetical protein